VELITAIILLGIVQGVFLGTGLLTIRRGNRRANRLLGLLMLLFSFSISHTVFYNTGLYYRYPHLIMLSYPVLFLFGPLLYFYVRLLMQPGYRFLRQAALNFIPFLLSIIGFVPFYILSGEQKLQIFRSGLQQGFTSDLIVMPLQIIHLFIYLYIVNRLVDLHAQVVHNNFSALEKINLSWIRTFVFMFLGVFGIMAVMFLIAAAGHTQFLTENAANIVALLVSVNIYGAGYMGLRQPEIFTGVDETENERKKYERSTLTPEQADQYLSKLPEFMKTEKPFLKTDLSVRELAGMCGIPAYHLSRIINERLHRNFFDFVNRYRVEEAVSLFQNPKFDHYRIMAIAKQSGFNSKSVFNAAFKKFKSTTPSQFRRHQDNNPS